MLIFLSCIILNRIYSVSKTKMLFINLPNTDPRVVAVDIENGMWVHCICGTRKACRAGRPFTLSYYHDHLVTVDHCEGMTREQGKKELDAKVKANDPSLTEKDRKRHKIEGRTQAPLKGFLVSKPKPTKATSTTESEKESQSPQAQSDTDGSNTDPPSTSTKQAASTTLKSTSKQRYCYGVFHDYNSAGKKNVCGITNSQALAIYGKNCAVVNSSTYKFGMVGSYYQVFAKDCTGNVNVRNRVHGKGNAHWSCNNCHSFIESKKIYKIGQTIRNRGLNILRAINANNRPELTDQDYSDLKKFVDGNSDSNWSQEGLALMDRFKSTVRYCQTVRELTDSSGKPLVAATNGDVPSTDKFRERFMTFYDNESIKSPEKQDLIFALMQVQLAMPMDR